MRVRTVISVLAALLLSACASAPGRADDPFEPLNRAMYAVNKPIDDHVMRPIAQAYVDYVPKLFRQAVSNVFGNIDDLFSGINGLLQGKTDKAGNDFGRVIVNIWGVCGLIDIASDLGIPKGNEDFGQTFGYWGIPQGPYLFVPLWGPTTVRDGTGSLIRVWYGPVGYIPYVPLRNITLRPRRHRPARERARHDFADRGGFARPIHIHPARLPAAPPIRRIRRQAAARKGRMNAQFLFPFHSVTLARRWCSPLRHSCARAGSAGCHGQARRGRGAADRAHRSQGAGRRPAAHPRGDRDQAPAPLRLRADDRAGDGPQLAEGDARAAEAADRSIPHAARADVFRRAVAVPRPDDGVQAAARRSRRDGRHRAHGGRSGPARRRSRSTTA